MTRFDQSPRLVRVITRAADYAFHDLRSAPEASPQQTQARHQLADVLDVAADLAPSQLAPCYRAVAGRHRAAAPAVTLLGRPVDRVLAAVLQVALHDVDRAVHKDGFKAAALIRLAEIQEAIADHVADPSLARRWRRVSQSSLVEADRILDEVQRPPWSASA